jgi:EAL domain-containing protein (putative c-di-GMP-specific phosphodiesterase class I)
MILDLGRTLDLEVIAEGIETSAQLEALRVLGVGLGQGYLLGRPSAATPGRSERREAAMLGAVDEV